MPDVVWQEFLTMSADAAAHAESAAGGDASDPRIRSLSSTRARIGVCSPVTLLSLPCSVPDADDSILGPDAAAGWQSAMSAAPLVLRSWAGRSRTPRSPGRWGLGTGKYWWLRARDEMCSRGEEGRE